MAYYLFMYVWPMIVFRKYLAGKDKTFRFAFCACAMILVVNTAMILLGLFHILNRFTVCLFFYGVLIGSILRQYHITKKHVDRFKSLVSGTYGVRNFRRNIRMGAKDIIRKSAKTIDAFFAGRRIEYYTLIALLIFGNMYFGYWVVSRCTLGVSDLPVHLSWVYGLNIGRIFYGGVYPEGMHCLISAIHMVFGKSTSGRRVEHPRQMERYIFCQGRKQLHLRCVY